MTASRGRVTAARGRKVKTVTSVFFFLLLLAERAKPVPFTPFLGRLLHFVLSAACAVGTAE